MTVLIHKQVNDSKKYMKQSGKMHFVLRVVVFVIVEVKSEVITVDKVGKKY